MVIFMISNIDSLDRDIKHLKNIYEHLRIKMNIRSFAGVLATFGKTILTNPLFMPYIKNIDATEKAYRQRPEIASILKKASYHPTTQQALDQEMLTRTEETSEYFSLWIILRFNELYFIDVHQEVKKDLEEKNDVRDLAEFNLGIKTLSDILNDNIVVNFEEYYLHHAYHVLSGITRFFENHSTEEIPNYKTDSINSTNAEPKKIKKSISNIKPATAKFTQNNMIFLSLDANPEDSEIIFKESKGKEKEDTLRIKVLTALWENPDGFSKRALAKKLGVKVKQITDVCTGVNNRVRVKWRDWNCHEYIPQIKYKKLKINANYPTKIVKE